MPIIFSFRPEANLIVCAHSGRVPDDEFLSRYKAMFRTNPSATAMNLLIDLRETDSSPRSAEVLRRLAEFMTSKYVDARTCPKIAVVATKDLAYGLARMYESLSDSIPWEFAVFRSAESAFDWLEIPEDLRRAMDQPDQPDQQNNPIDGEGAPSRTS